MTAPLASKVQKSSEVRLNVDSGRYGRIAKGESYMDFEYDSKTGVMMTTHRHQCNPDILSNETIDRLYNMISKKPGRKS